MQARALCGAALVVIPLAAAAGTPDPLVDHARERVRIARRRRDLGLESGRAHCVPDPAELDVLLLQEVVVRELRIGGHRQTRAAPVRLHAQAFGERAIVEILAMPAAAP